MCCHSVLTDVLQLEGLVGFRRSLFRLGELGSVDVPKRCPRDLEGGRGLRCRNRSGSCQALSYRGGRVMLL